MHGSEMLAVRNKLNMARKDFGLLLGYGGDFDQIFKTIKRYEEDRRPIPPTIARLVYLVGLYFDGAGRAPEWPVNIDPEMETETT